MSLPCSIRILRTHLLEWLPGVDDALSAKPLPLHSAKISRESPAAQSKIETNRLHGALAKLDRRSTYEPAFSLMFALVCSCLYKKEKITKWFAGEGSGGGPLPCGCASRHARKHKIVGGTRGCGAAVAVRGKAKAQARGKSKLPQSTGDGPKKKAKAKAKAKKPRRAMDDDSESEGSEWDGAE